MNYNELIKLLLSDKVYQDLKQNESEIFKLIPELEVCKGFDQKNQWHVYDVYEHILHVVEGVEATLPLRVVALFHDTGKPLAFTLDDEGVGHFYGHWDRSVEIFERYLPKLALSDADAKLISALIFYHDVNVEKLTAEQVDKMVSEIGRDNLKYLFAIKRADLLAQAPKYHYLLENIQRLEENFTKKEA